MAPDELELEDEEETGTTRNRRSTTWNRPHCSKAMTEWTKRRRKEELVDTENVVYSRGKDYIIISIHWELLGLSLIIEYIYEKEQNKICISVGC